MLMTDLISGHFDELGPLLRQRLAADESWQVTTPRWRELEERCVAHLDALGIFADDLPPLLLPMLDEEPAAVVAALLAADLPAVVPLLPRVELALLPLMRLWCGPRVSAVLHSDPSPAASALLNRAPDHVWFSAEQVALRALAWALPWTTAPVAVDEPERVVRDAARRAWIERRDSRWQVGPEVEVLPWAARVASATEQSAVSQRLWAQPPAPWVYVALAALGAPADAERLIDCFSSPDPALAVAAGTAFRALTGIDVDSDRRVDLDGDGEFATQAWLPDPQRAVHGWQRLRSQLGQATRINRGVSVDDALAANDDRLDRFTLASVALRRCWRGR